MTDALEDLIMASRIPLAIHHLCNIISHLMSSPMPLCRLLHDRAHEISLGLYINSASQEVISQSLDDVSPRLNMAKIEHLVEDVKHTD